MGKFAFLCRLWVLWACIWHSLSCPRFLPMPGLPPLPAPGRPEHPAAPTDPAELPGARCSAKQGLRASKAYFCIYGKRRELSVCRY